MYGVKFKEVKSEFSGHVAITTAGMFPYAISCLIKKVKKILQMIIKKRMK